MGSLPRDFKSLASADFAILAYLCIDIQLLCNAKVKSLASACFAIPARFCGIFVSPPAAVCAGPCLAAADFSACRRRLFCAPPPIFRRAVADLLFVHRRPFLRAAAFCGRSRLGWRALLAAPPLRLSRGGRGKKAASASREAEADLLEAPPGFEPGSQGFAGPCLTTWL